MKKQLSHSRPKLCFFLTMCIFCWSCSGTKKETLTTFDPIGCDTLHHAKGFQIEHSKEAVRLTVISPWNKGQILARYYLVNRTPNHSDKPVYADGTTIEVPLKRAALTSCTQIGFIDRLKAIGSIVGISYPERVYHQEVNNRIRRNETINLGDPFQLDVERLLACHPDVLFLSGYNEPGNYEKSLEQSGVTVVYINEWLESSALARAEWLRFLGYFYQEGELSKQLFNQIETEYTSLRDSIKTRSSKPKILSGEDFRGSWYMAKGDNWMSRLYVDAGGNYPLAEERGTGSQSFALEEVYKRFSDSDKWMGVDAQSLSELKEKEIRYSKFKAFQQGEVYHFNKRRTSTGGNDFWEEGVVDPAGLLRDLITVFYNREGNLRYTERLANH